MDFVKPKKIFIVDDDLMLREALTDYLSRNISYEVSSFGTGEECLQNLFQDPDIIILDYYLNSVHKDAANGNEILQVIRRNYPKIRVIMLSSQEKYSVAMQSIQKGAEQYVIKDEDAFDKIAQLISEV